ncbi:FHA domain-containing protein [Neorhizobium lilium]|uniref:FHA domain-containing protein n=1 Tax=Neorhizobium lilium TaxID=2503024 RepID=A0A3S3RYD8_9HYPH|nr:FHA domain-containing protein [Neorhizobium lilium]RWX81500.1 FHA domain-containing protein [Neorhizobium lilium]
MRLELREITGGAVPSTSRSKWFFERGRRTIGRAPDCDWQLPDDQRSVSKLHCTIERDREGFLLRDQSANGSQVDGIVVHEGEVARLADQSRLEVGGLKFSVHISGETDLDMEDPDAGLALSDDRLTISSILSDIAPGGRTATGILGERIGDDWPIAPSSRKEGAASSRNVEIGWSGPPEIQSATKILPDDWYKEGDSEYGSHLEHGAATHIAVPVSRTRPADLPGTVNDNVPLSDTDDFAPLSIGRSCDIASRLETLIARLEESLEGAFAIFEMETPRPDRGSGVITHDEDDALVARAEALLRQHTALNAGLEALVRESSRLMEPRILESRVDANPRRLPWIRDRDYWQAYRAQFEKDGHALSVREVFRDAMMQAPNAAGSRILPTGQKGNAEHEE